MEVICEHCNSKFNIPDEKVPRDRQVKIPCPKCKSKITLDTRKPAEERISAQETASKADQASKEKAYGYSDYSDDAVGFLEEGVKLALVMVSNANQLEGINRAVEELGYKYISSPDTRDAIGKMRFHHFDLIILADGFDGQPLEYSPIINSLNHISMSVRRRIFLVLLSDKLKTMDSMMAFAMSANLVINTGDIDQLLAILKKSISENERFYKIFMDTMVEMGKA